MFIWSLTMVAMQCMKTFSFSVNLRCWFFYVFVTDRRKVVFERDITYFPKTSISWSLCRGPREMLLIVIQRLSHGWVLNHQSLVIFHVIVYWHCSIFFLRGFKPLLYWIGEGFYSSLELSLLHPFNLSLNALLTMKGIITWNPRIRHSSIVIHKFV